MIQFRLSLMCAMFAMTSGEHGAMMCTYNLISPISILMCLQLWWTLFRSHQVNIRSLYQRIVYCVIDLIDKHGRTESINVYFRSICLSSRRGPFFNAYPRGMWFTSITSYTSTVSSASPSTHTASFSANSAPHATASSAAKHPL